MQLPSILLLDCAEELEKRLKKLGYDVESGSLGYVTGSRILPSQVYEKDIFIYDPPIPDTDENGRRSISSYIREETPEYPLAHFHSHLQRGGLLLAFIKPLDSFEHKLREAYEWIPAFPEIELTSDRHVEVISELDEVKWLRPLLSEKYPKIPVEIKISGDGIQGLYFNRNGDKLGGFINFGNGRVILLPNGESNEQVIMNFLNRVVPKVFSFTSGDQLINRFVSPKEKLALTKLSTIEQEISKDEEKRDGVMQELVSARSGKINKIRQDETAVLILNYFDLALQQDDVALFYIYKIIEALEGKYGSERQAKLALGNNAGWTHIGKLANATYADVRHAPMPGEKVKEWTDEDIKNCFSEAEAIIAAYLNTLF